MITLKIIRKIKSQTKSVLLAGIFVPALGVLASANSGPYKGLVAHEWGTFTSVQGGDGILLDWRPLETSRLPSFVYRWNKPGLGRVSTQGGGFGKTVISTLQRMETPVIYFYSDLSRTVDVSVKFPQGFITEWYPQAAQIGPSIHLTPMPLTNVDGAAHNLATDPGSAFVKDPKDSATAASRVRWSHLEILSANEGRDRMPSLPRDASGSHYFSARETDANLLRLDSIAGTNAPELEKFIFYRGVGSFGTPLKVTAEGSDKITLENTGTEALESLFILTVHEHQGRFIEISRIEGKQKGSVVLFSTRKDLSVEKLAKGLGEQMEKSLTRQGLYPKEAAAMVKTWRDSWFEEDGVRVLYILPRAWTDKTLPLEINPAPQELVRVMVGRAEVLTPAREEKLQEAITKATNGDLEAQHLAEAELKKLGRFAEPALTLLQKNASPARTQKAWALLQNTRMAPPAVWE